jgi:hypothetical protein
VSTPYLPPLEQLLALGEPEFENRRIWPDYLAMGLAEEHVPELIRLLTDEELASGEPEAPANWALLHAWRTLGQLRAEAAIEPLIATLSADDDWAMVEVPSVLGMIGPPALEPLRVALAKWSLAPEPWIAGSLGAALVDLATQFPEARDAAVAALARQLAWWARHEPILNTLLIHNLVELNAVEAAPVIEEAFAADRVETENDNDWEDVQVALGLLPERITPRPKFVPSPLLFPTSDQRAPAPGPAADPTRRRKAKKAARKRKRK